MSPNPNTTHRGFALLVSLVLLGTVGSGCSLFYTPPEPIENFSLATPTETYRSFKKAVVGGNDFLIWRTISDRRKEEDGITWSDYWTYKDLVKTRYGRSLRLLEKSELESIEVRGDTAQLHLTADSMEVYVQLIRESYFEIVVDRPGQGVYCYYEFVDAAAPYVTHRDGEIHVELPLSTAKSLPEGQIVAVRILDEWKFYSVSEPTPIESSSERP